MKGRDWLEDGLNQILMNYPLTMSLTDITKSNIEGYFTANYTVTDCNGLVVSTRGVAGLTQENLNSFKETVWVEECEESKEALAQEEGYIYWADWDSLDYYEDQSEY